MGNLLNHPEVSKKARTEIEEQIGSDRLIEEQDIVKLPYLQNIMSETLRLYPVVPMLLPHMASEDCIVAGYDVPRGTMVMVNAWAFHRDPNTWEEPEKFDPERFAPERAKKRVKYSYLPFAAGKRSCIGGALSQIENTLALVQLLRRYTPEYVGPKPAKIHATVTLCPKGGLPFRIRELS